MSREEDKLIGQIDAKIVRAKNRKKRFSSKKEFSEPTIRYWRHPLLEELWGINEEVRLQELSERKLREVSE